MNITQHVDRSVEPSGYNVLPVLFSGRHGNSYVKIQYHWDNAQLEEVTGKNMSRN